MFLCEGWELPGLPRYIKKASTTCLEMLAASELPILEIQTRDSGFWSGQGGAVMCAESCRHAQAMNSKGAWLEQRAEG